MFAAPMPPTKKQSPRKKQLSDRKRKRESAEIKVFVQ